MKSIKVLFTSLLLLVGVTACANGNPSSGYRNENAENNRLVTKVELNQSGEVIMELGSELIVVPTISYKDDKEVKIDTSWVSSRPSVAKVENGVVTALSGGSAVITFIAGFKSANFTVTINSDVPVVTPTDESIVLNIYDRTITKGATFQLTASLSSGEEATPKFASDNTAVATVSDTGLVTGASAGVANITVTLNEKSAKCIVTVIEDDEPVEEEDYDYTVFFFVDYNNIDENDTTGTKLLAKFGWYHNEPIANSGKVPAAPTVALDPAFPYFVGWSTHTIIDTKDDLCDLSTYTVENAHFLFLYGIWSDVEVLVK